MSSFRGMSDAWIGGAQARLADEEKKANMALRQIEVQQVGELRAAQLQNYRQTRKIKQAEQALARQAVDPSVQGRIEDVFGVEFEQPLTRQDRKQYKIPTVGAQKATAAKAAASWRSNRSGSTSNLKTFSTMDSQSMREITNQIKRLEKSLNATDSFGMTVVTPEDKEKWEREIRQKKQERSDYRHRRTQTQATMGMPKLDRVVNQEDIEAAGAEFIFAQFLGGLPDLPK